MEQIDVAQRVEDDDARSFGLERAHAGERLFVDHLGMIQRVSAAVARQYRLSADEAEEFGATVQLRLIVDDYAVLRKFRRQCSLQTFLTVVIQRICLDFRDSQWGKWRTSAAAKREGAVAIRLERLTMRDGLTFEEACAQLALDPDVTVERDTLARIYSQLRVRVRRRFVPDNELCEVPTTHGAPDRPILEAEQTEELSYVMSALTDAMLTMSTRDRLLLKLRFADDLPVAAVARLLRLDQKWLYRRYAGMFAKLRKRLELQGVTRRQVVPLIGEAMTNDAQVFAEARDCYAGLAAG
jgi:RNA polymerase sigma factor (sigma-70 family)